jgi:hypothetical protein
MSILCILKAVAAWVILMLVGSNLIGFIVRGLLWAPPPIDLPPDSPAHEFLSSESNRMSAGNVVITLISIIIAGAYLFGLFYFWDALLTVAAGLLMASRLPDLLWEIRTGKKVTKHSRPKGAIYTFTTIILWAALPLIWYALCR